MDDLITWLRAQLDDDERIARKNTGQAGLGDDGDFPDYRTYDGADIDAAVDFLHHFTSQRVLREVEAKRRMLDLYEAADPGFVGTLLRNCLDTPVRLLALPFSDRPGYREEWKP
jgi:hypothetical protein